MTTRDWESELAELLHELSCVQDELLDVLIQKRAQMVSGDAAGMQHLQPREEELCQRLQTCHDRRAELLQAASLQGLPVQDLGQLASSVPGRSRGRMGRQVQQASARMRLLQHQSLTNWVLAQRTLLHLAQILETIASGGRTQPTYGSQTANSACGALVDQEV